MSGNNTSVKTDLIKNNKLLTQKSIKKIKT